ncbi:nitroreductase family protein [Terrabacter sp. GCM10028922]|uniref:SagB/ThcOx family dehydrogenase n=1 Tax=Terrabacter sp. GCM10028922 TaxID=3273428 RepID=UPI0036065808
MAPDDERPTHLLHRLTCYSTDREWTEVPDDDRLVQDLVPNDLARRPRPYKGYDDDLHRILLPADLPASSAPATAVLSGAAGVDASALDLPGLARLLYLSSGVTRRTTRPDGGVVLFRAAGSAGARFPLELYVAVPRGAAAEGLEPGLHWYDPEAHALVVVGPPPTGDAPTIVVTGVPWRTGWRYRERGFRHIYWDAGTMLAQLLALADSAGLTARLFTGFPDAEVAALVGADRVHEFPVALVALGPGRPAVHPTGDPLPGHHDTDGLEFPLVTAAQRAGEQTQLGPELERGAPVRLVSADPGPSIDAVVVSKGSIRRLHPDRTVPHPVLLDAMAASLRGVTVPHWVGVSGVDDVPTGIHLWPDVTTPVRPLPEQAVRAELFTAALEQGLARDASFVVMSGTDLAGLDDHAYREVQLLSGLAEGRLHLMAYALGAAASGMTFRDSDLAHLLGRDVAGLLWTCVGVPEYRTRPSGLPGSPADVTIVWPR